MTKSKLGRWFYKTGNYCGLVSLIAASVSVVFMCLLIAADVIGRGIFSTAISFAFETSGYLLIGIAFLGLAITELEDRHIVINIFTRRLPPRRRQQLEVAVLILISAFLIWFILILIDFVKMEYVTNTVSIGTMHINMWIPHSVGPLGFILFVIVALAKIVQKLNHLAETKDIK